MSGRRKHTGIVCQTCCDDFSCFEYDYGIVKTKDMRMSRTVGYINLLSDVDGVIALVELYEWKYFDY